MKKLAVFLLAGCMVAALLAGCSGGQSTPTTEEPAFPVTDVITVTQQDMYPSIYDETYTLSIPEDWKYEVQGGYITAGFADVQWTAENIGAFLVISPYTGMDDEYQRAYRELLLGNSAMIEQRLAEENPENSDRLNFVVRTHQGNHGKIVEVQYDTLEEINGEERLFRNITYIREDMPYMALCGYSDTENTSLPYISKDVALWIFDSLEVK